MKKLKLTTFVLILITSYSCTDLETLPKNTLLPNVLFQDEGSYISYCASYMEVLP